MTQSPFLKWAGGKRWIAEALTDLLGAAPRRYHEPFLGGGSLFFRTEAHEAFLADLNEELVNAFIVVRDAPDRLIEALRVLKIERDLFEMMRSWRPLDSIERAVRLIYLNRTAFNGLYRVNKQGAFNVPFGCKPGTKVCDEPQIRWCSSRLRNASIKASDFRTSLERVESGDFVFLDPPYTVKHANNGFRRYNETLFAWRDQVDLASRANSLARRGAIIIIMNAWHPEVLALYDSRLFTAVRATRSSNMAASTESRGRYAELVLASRQLLRSSRAVARLIKGALPNCVAFPVRPWGSSSRSGCGE